METLFYISNGKEFIKMSAETKGTYVLSYRLISMPIEAKYVFKDYLHAKHEMLKIATNIIF